MGILTRIRRILRANLHDAVSRAENPAKMLNYLVLEMEEALERAREEVATAMGSERRLAQQAADADQAAMQWEMRARRALEHGEDDLAREALRRKVAAVELAEHYGRAQEEQGRAVVQLRSSLVRLEKRLQEARVRRSEMLAQLDAVKAQQVVARSFRQSVGSDAFEAFDRLALEISGQQHRGTAMLELTHSDVEDAFVVAEESVAIEQELRSMKRELGYVHDDTPPALEQQGETT